MRKMTLALLLCLLSPALAQEDAEQPPDPKARFWQARQVMLTGDARSAAELFRILNKDHPESEIADDSLYWMGRCDLRVKDREPEAVVAFTRLIREHPASPFVDDAARELMRLKDLTIVPELKKRLAAGGPNAKITARALAEFDDETGIRFIMKLEGVNRQPSDPQPEPMAVRETEQDELQALKDEIQRLKKQVEESLALLEKLLAEKAREKTSGESEPK
jgi:outer membrane protein assembly factor BamD (BamD/ComL family)/HAMP domain-containing protein